MSPCLQDMFGQSSTDAAVYVSLESFFNALGRLAWAGLSDLKFLGRRRTFALFFAINFVLFASMPSIARAHSLGGFVFAVCIVLRFASDFRAIVDFPLFAAFTAAASLALQLSLSICSARRMLARCTAWCSLRGLQQVCALLCKVTYNAISCATLTGAAGPILITSIRAQNAAAASSPDPANPGQTIITDPVLLYSPTMYTMCVLFVLGLVLCYFVKPISPRELEDLQRREHGAPDAPAKTSAESELASASSDANGADSPSASQPAIR